MKKLDKNIALLEDYLEWQKLHDMDGTGIDEATKNLIEVAKKYQKIEEAMKMNDIVENIYFEIERILGSEDGNNR